RPQIDTEDRRTAARYQARRRYHRAVPSKHDQQITVVGDFPGGSGERTRRQILYPVVNEEVDLLIGRPLGNLRRELSRAWFVWLGDDTESRRGLLSHRHDARCVKRDHSITFHASWAPCFDLSCTGTHTNT